MSAEGDPELVAAAKSAEPAQDEVSEEAPDHIPNGDDTYSPLHAAEDGGETDDTGKPEPKEQGA